MNSLVVLLSVVALAAAKPSVLAPLTYSAPIIAAAPAAFSSQSRLDIKSSPAIVETGYTPIAKAAVVASPYYAPAVAAAPVAYAAAAAPVAYAAPIAPVAYTAPAAFSSQSRLDIKSTPAITSTYVSSPVVYSAPAAAVAPIINTFAARALVKSTVVPAAIDAAAVPLETAEVIAAPAAHIAPAAHLIKKRSLVASPIVYAGHVATPFVSTYSAPIYHAPLTAAVATPVITKTYIPW